MNVKKRGWKWCLAVILSLIMCISILPGQAFAFVGPVIGGSDQEVSFFAKDGMNVAQIRNDYITFEIDAKGGVICRTVPTKDKDVLSLKGSYDKYIYQELQFHLDYYEKGEFYDLTPKTVEASEAEDGLSVQYTFNELPVTCELTFRLIETTEGIYRGTYTAPVTMERYEKDHGPDTHGRTFMVGCFAYWEGLTGDTGDGCTYIKMSFHRLPYYGHESETKVKAMVASRGTFDGGTREASIVNISKGITITDTNGHYDSASSKYLPSYTDVGTLTYDEANPLVLLSNKYDAAFGGSDNLVHGVEGKHMAPYGGQAMYYVAAGDAPAPDKDVLQITSYGGDNNFDGMAIWWKPTYESWNSLGWGFRNLYAKGETVVPLGEGGNTIESEFAWIETNAARLAVIPKGDGFTVEEVVEGAKNEEELLKKACTVFSGNFVYIPTEDYYEFKGGRAYLSPTVCASFSKNDPNAWFHLKRSDASIDYQNIRLNVPNYCFYKSKNNGAEPKFSYDAEKGLMIELDPFNNSAYISVNVPYTKTELNGAAIHKDGSVDFSGGMRFLTIFDNVQFQIDQFRLGYTNEQKKEYGLTGLNATVDVKNVNLFGLKVNHASGHVDTMTPDYYFELEINAYDVFEFAGELKLTEVDGALVPDKLVASLASDLVSIPIIPDVPVAEINGFTVGFDNLADTMNGDYTILPPLDLIIGARAKILKIIEGDARVAIGATGVSIEGSDLAIPPGENGLKIIESLSMSLKWGAGQRIIGQPGQPDYNVFNGVRLKLGMGAKINLMKGKSDSDSNPLDGILVITGGLDLGGFGGKSTRTKEYYFELNATGKVAASLNTPKAWGVFGGITLLSTTAKAAALVNTKVDFSQDLSLDLIKEALSNAKGYLGICWDGEVAGVFGRVYFITPSDFGYDYSLSSMEDFSIQSHFNSSSGTVQTLPIVDENEKVVGLAVVDPGLKEQRINIKPAGLKAGSDELSDDFTVTYKGDAGLSPEDTVILEVKPEQEISSQEFLSGLKIDGTPIVEIELGEEGEIANNGNIRLQTEEDSDLVTAAYLYLDPTKHSWNISSDGFMLYTDPELYVCNPDMHETLDITGFTGTALNGTVRNLDPEAAYEVQVYMGKDPDSSDCVTGDPIRIPAGVSEYSFTSEVPVSGELLESGDYYVSAALHRIETGDFDSDGLVSDEEMVLIPLDRWASGDAVHYVNSNTPEMPQDVSALATGNETVTASFREVENADGYRIEIYKDGEDTGYGYMLPVGEDKTLEGTGCSAATSYEDGKYTLRLAPTVGGTAPEETGSEQEQHTPLQPGDGYSIGVSAFRYRDPENKKAVDFSEESMSDPVNIREYQKADLQILLNGRELQKDENSIYKGLCGSSLNLGVNVLSDGNYLIEASVQNDESGVKYETTGKEFSQEFAGIEGTAMLEVVVTNTDTGDKTSAFVQVDVDTVPPILRMDADSFIVDADGHYLLTGTTEPGAAVNGVTAGPDGRFELPGTAIQRVGIVTKKYIAYSSVDSRFEDYIEEKEDFDGAIRMGYIVEPAEWGGPGTYVFTYLISQSANYQESYYQECLEKEANGEITDLRIETKEYEVSEPQAEEIEEDEWISVRMEDRVITQYTEFPVTAEDASGNQTEVTVMLIPHMHSFGEWKIVKKATVFADGQKQRTCPECGEIETEAIPKLRPALTLAAGNVKVSNTTVPMKKGQTFKKIKATMQAGDSLKSAKSSKKKVVSVKISKNKLILKAGKKTGKAKITVTTKAGAKSTFTVKVQKGKVTAKKIQGIKKTVTLKKGLTYQIPKSVIPVTVTDKMTFKSSKPKVAAVSKKGKVTAKKKGKAVITVTVGKKKFKCTIIVK